MNLSFFNSLIFAVVLPALLKAQSPYRFQFDNIPDQTVSGRSFPITVIALNSDGTRATNFNAEVGLRSFARQSPSIVISEISGDRKTVEFCNTGAEPIDLGGWEFEAARNFSDDRTRAEIPAGIVVSPGGTVIWTSGTNIFGDIPTIRNSQPLAGPSGSFGVLGIRRPSGQLVDEVALSFPFGVDISELWNGTVVSLPNQFGRSLSRIGRGNQFHASDWMRGPESLGRSNPGLSIPWEGNRQPAEISPSQIRIAAGAWTGDIILAGREGVRTIAAESSPGLIRESRIFSLVAAPALRLMPASPANASEAQPGTILGFTVSIPAPTTNDLEVLIGVTDPLDFGAPSSVVIPAGAIGAQFAVTNRDDTVPDGLARIVLSASATGYSGATSELLNADNESGILDLDLPESAFEDSGFLSRRGRVLIGNAQSHDVMVRLTSEVPVVVPEYVVIPAGQTVTEIPIRVGDDRFVNPVGRTVSITATMPGWPESRASIRLIDDDSPAFTVVWPDELVEGRTAEAIVRLVNPRDHEQTLTITSESAQITVPAGMTIPAGATEQRVPISVADDNRPDSQPSSILRAYVGDEYGGDLRVFPADDDAVIQSITELYPPLAVFRGETFDLGIMLQSSGLLPRDRSADGTLSATLASGQTVALEPGDFLISGGQASVPVTINEETLGLRITAQAAGFSTTSRPMDVIQGRVLEGDWADLSGRFARETLLLIRKASTNSTAALIEINPATGTLLRELHLTNSPTRMDVSYDGNTAWLATESGQLAKVDLQQWQVTKTASLETATNSIRLYAFAIFPNSSERILVCIQKTPSGGEQRSEVLLLNDGTQQGDPLILPDGQTAYEAARGRFAHEMFVRTTFFRVHRLTADGTSLSVAATGQSDWNSDDAGYLALVGNTLFTGGGQRFSADNLAALDRIPADPVFGPSSIVVPFPELNGVGLIDQLLQFRIHDVESARRLGAHGLPEPRHFLNRRAGRTVRYGHRGVAQLIDDGNYLRVWESPLADPTPADLALSVDAPEIITQPGFSWDFTVTNKGPGIARQVRLSFSNSAPVEVGLIAPGTSRTVSVGMGFTWAPFIIRESVFAEGASLDPNTSDNFVAPETAIAPAMPDWFKVMALDSTHMIASADGTRLYVALRRAALGHPAGVAVINPESGSVENVLPVGNDCRRLSTDSEGRWLWIQSGASRLIRWNLSSESIDAELRFDTEDIHDFIALPGEAARLAVALPSAISLYDGTNRLSSSAQAGPDRRHLGYAASRLWVARRGDLRAYDVSGGTWIQSGVPFALNLGSEVYGFTSGPSFLYFSGAVFDIATRQLLPFPGDVFFAESAGGAVYGNFGQAVRRYAPPSSEVLAEEPLPGFGAAGISEVVRWGTDGLAVRSESSLIIFRSSTVPAGNADLSSGFSQPTNLAPFTRFQVILSVTNQGPDTARNVRLAVTPHSQAPVVESQPAASFVRANQLYLQITELAPGTVANFTLSGTNQFNSFAIDCVVSAGANDTNTSNNRASVGINPRLPQGDLAIHSLIAPARVAGGEDFEANIVVTNRGSVTVESFYLSVGDRPSIELLSAQPGSIHPDCCGDFRTVGDLGRLEPGESKELRLRLLPYRGGIHELRIGVDGLFEDQSPENNRASSLIYVALGDMPGIVKELHLPGGTIRWNAARSNWVASVESGLALLEGTTFEPENIIPVPGFDRHFVMTDDGKYAWAVLQGNRLARADLETRQIDLVFQPAESVTIATGVIVPVHGAPETVLVAGTTQTGGVQVTAYDRGNPRSGVYSDLRWHGNGVRMLTDAAGRILVLTGGEFRELRLDAEGLVETRNLDAVGEYSAGEISRVGDVVFYGGIIGADLAAMTRLYDLPVSVGDAATGFGFGVRWNFNDPPLVEIRSTDVPSLRPRWMLRLPVSREEVFGQPIPMGDHGVLIPGFPNRLILNSRLGDRKTALQVSAILAQPVLGTNQLLETTLTITNRSHWTFPGGDLVVRWSDGMEPEISLSNRTNQSTFRLDAFDGGTNLTFRFWARTSGPQSIRLAVGSDIPDSEPEDNVAELLLDVPHPPKLLLGNSVLVEGNSTGPTTPFELILDRPTPEDITVTFRTESVTTDSGDTITSTPVAHFAAGERRALLYFIRGDNQPEPDEIIRLVFVSGAVSPTAQSVEIKVVNDDFPELLSMRTGVREGDLSITNMQIPVLLSTAAPFPVEMSFQLADAGAEAGVDYVQDTGRLVFAAGQRTNFIPLTIFGDRLFETNEIIAVQFDDFVRAGLQTNRNLVTILNDDLPPQPVANFHQLGTASGWEAVFESTAGATYRVQTTPGLHPAVWTTIGQSLLGDGTLRAIRIGETTNSTRFFRLIAE